MASRLGDWYAFSPSHFCRVLTVYDHMAWQGNELSDAHLLRNVAAAATAPLGGPVALLRASHVLKDSDYTDRLATSTLGSPLRIAGSSVGTREQKVELFSCAGVALGVCVVPIACTGPVVKLSWTVEEDLCVVTAGQICLFYSLCSPNAEPSPSLLPTGEDARNRTGYEPPTLTPSRAFSLLAGAEVPVQSLTDSPAAGKGEEAALDVPNAQPGRTTVALVVATAEGVVTLDPMGTVRGVLHGERQASEPLRAARLPRAPGDACGCANVLLTRRDGICMVPLTTVTTALAFVGPSAHDGGTTLLLWSTTTTATAEAAAGGEGDARQGSRLPSYVHACRWEDLPAANSNATGDRRLSSLNRGDPGDTDLDDDDDELSNEDDSEADLGLLDPEVAEARRIQRRKQRRKQRRHRKRLARKRLLAMTAPNAGTGGVDGLAFGTADGGELATGKIASAAVLGAVTNLALCPADPSQLAVLTDADVLYRLTTDLSRAPFTLDLGLALHRLHRLPHAGRSDAASHSVSQASELVWCGPHYVLLGTSAEAQTLLVPLHAGRAVRCERLDWRVSGRTGLVLAAEVDGARVLTEAGCYMIEEVPPVLVALGRLQPPFCAAHAFLAAYRDYARGHRDGLARVRAALRDHPCECVPLTFLCLLEAACSEWNRERQLLLLAAADFLLDLTICDPSGSARMQETVVRLRVLAARRRGGVAAGEDWDGGDPECQEGDCDCLALARQPAGCMPLTMTQYALLGGLVQRHEGNEDVGEHGDGEDGYNGDSDSDLGFADDENESGAAAHTKVAVLKKTNVTTSARSVQSLAEMQQLSRSLLLASVPLTAREGQVLVDRLLARRAYQRALFLSRCYGAMAARVVTEWACAKVRDAVTRRTVGISPGGDDDSNGGSEQKLITSEDARVLTAIRDVFARVADVSYAGCAAVALEGGRPALACALLEHEPPSGRKVLMLTAAGSIVDALRTAVASTDADLLYATVRAALASSALTTNAEDERDAMRISIEVPAATAATLLAFPDVVCCLVQVAGLRVAWRDLVAQVLLSATPAACRWWFAMRVANFSLDAALAGHSAAGLHDLRQACEEVASCRRAGDDQRPTSQEGKMADTDQNNDATNAAADEVPDFSLASVAGEVLLPLLQVPRPPLSTAALLLDSREKRQITEAVRSAKAAASANGALPLTPSRDVLLKRVWGLDRAEAAEQWRSAEVAATLRPAHAVGSPPANFSLTRSVDSVAFSALSPSCGLTPTQMGRALEQQQRLEKEQRILADTLGDARFVTSVSSVVDTLALLAEHGAWAEAEALRRDFGVREVKSFFATFLALCKVGEWELVAELLGPPPPLVPERRGLVSSRETADAGLTAGARCGQPPPPGAYEAIVDTLIGYGKAELAAKYVPGITVDPATRVDWYMNRLGAPIMALEAAYVGGDADLIRQILERVPQNARAQNVGGDMLADLEGD